jgi:hypothetical protein
MLNVIYVLKGCILVMYSRLTLGLREERAVKAVAVYVVIGWTATELAFFLACRPFYGYWAMPPPSPQCSTLQHYAMTQAVFNITSDACMLLIPLPLVIRMKIPLRKKLTLIVVLSMGIFVILAAILTKVYNLSNLFDPSYMLWYIRESSVAVLVANIPLVWPLLREWFPILRKISPSRPFSSTLGSPGSPGSPGSGEKWYRFSRKPKDNSPGSAMPTWRSSTSTKISRRDQMRLLTKESLDSIMQTRTSFDIAPKYIALPANRIHKDVTIEISEERISKPERPYTPCGSQVYPEEERDHIYDWGVEGGSSYFAGVEGVRKPSIARSEKRHKRVLSRPTAAMIPPVSRGKDDSYDEFLKTQTSDFDQQLNRFS